ncbi:CBS domain-containing protein [Nonomuraea sp. B19D2]|uniref:CBS domain-containing protein n=1 Tax=Nonomuraea sp. B19D2 TaxID=3159561 RepID=UPI0032DBAD5D
MTAEVVTVGTATRFQEIVALLYAHGISGVPVLDRARQVCGVIAGADLVAGHGSSAGRLMTAPAYTIGPEASAEEAVRVLSRYHIGRLPVVRPETGQLLGIVTRSDLLRIRQRPDKDILLEVANMILASHPGHVAAHVRSGVVTLLGRVERRSTVADLVELVRQVEGVVRVHERIDCDLDDSHPAPAIRWGGRT